MFTQLTDLSSKEQRKTYEIHQPWVLYTYMRDDLHAMLFGGKINMMCAFCGESEVLYIPRRHIMFPSYYNPMNRAHPKREAFLALHIHRNEPTWNKLAWKMPLANPVNVSRRGARDEGLVN